MTSVLLEPHPISQRQKNAAAYITIDRQHLPRLKIDCSFAYPGMTAGVCWSAQVSGPISATSPIPCLSFEQGDK